MKRHPLRILHQNQPRRDHELRKVIWLDTHLFMPLQVDSGLL